MDLADEGMTLTQYGYTAKGKTRRQKLCPKTFFYLKWSRIKALPNGKIVPIS